MAEIRDMKLFSYNDIREMLEYGKQTLLPLAQFPQITDIFFYWMDCKLAGKSLDLPQQPESIVQKPLDKDAEICDNKSREEEKKS